VTPISNNTWYHAAVTYDRATLRLYLNGNLESEVFVGQLPRFDSIQHAAIGTTITSTGAAEGFFDGVIDEVRIWNVARSATEIRQTINQQLTTTPTGLIGRWGMEEGPGPNGTNRSVGDSAGSAQNGTINGNNYAWTSGAPFNMNLAPNQPVLFAPTDNASNQTTSPLSTSPYRIKRTIR
jgi:hypothetical protein